MAVTYIVIPKGNPRDKKAPKRFYAHATSRGEISLKKLSKEILDRSTTVSDTDVLAVMNDLTKVVIKHLANGEIVRLGDFGSFQISIGSEGADQMEEFNSSLITFPRIVFRPGTDLKEMLNDLEYEKLTE